MLYVCLSNKASVKVEQQLLPNPDDLDPPYISLIIHPRSTVVKNWWFHQAFSSNHKEQRNIFENFSHIYFCFWKLFFKSRINWHDIGKPRSHELWKHGLLGFTKVRTSTALCWPEKNWQLVQPPFHTFMTLQNMVTTTIEMHYSHPINLLMILVDFAASSIS